MATQVSTEQQRIARDLHLGSAKLPADKLVMVKAGDVVQLVNAFNAEMQRADIAETKLEALSPLKSGATAELAASDSIATH
jgi:hypothetical protein